MLGFPDSRVRTVRTPSGTGTIPENERFCAKMGRALIPAPRTSCVDGRRKCPDIPGIGRCPNVPEPDGFGAEPGQLVLRSFSEGEKASGTGHFPHPDCPDTVRNRDDSRNRTFLRENGTRANSCAPNVLRRWAKKVSGHSQDRTVSGRSGTGRFWRGTGTNPGTGHRAPPN